MNNDKKAYAQREKAYMNGKLFPFIRVGMQFHPGRNAES